MTKEIDNILAENKNLKSEISKLKKIIEEINESQSQISRGMQQKSGMLKKASAGNLQSRVPFGYRLENKTLIPAENFREVEEIFEEFLEEKMTLNKLAKKHNLSVNGLKKILTNFTYIGKIKFDKQIYTGKHKPIISTTLFNHVQNKLEKINKKNKGNFSSKT